MNTRPTRAVDDETLIAFLDATATRVRAGDSPLGALRAAMRDRPRVAERLGAALLDGDAPPDATTAGERLVLHTCALVRTSGGCVAETLDSAASVLRARAAIRAEAHTHSAQARLSAAVLTCIPVGMAALIALGRTGRATMASPLGLVCVGVGATLNLLGWWWMRHLIAAAVR